MKLRRRIAFPKAPDHAEKSLQVPNYSRDWPREKWGSTVILRGSTSRRLMSALGQKQTSARVHVMSALPPKADIGIVHYVPAPGMKQRI